MISLSTKNWKLENIDTVLFDKDGTLLDSHIYWGRIIQLRALAIMSAYNLSYEVYKNLFGVMGLDFETKKLKPEGPIALVSREVVIDTIIKYLHSQGMKTNFFIISELFNKVHKEFNRELQYYITPLQGALALVENLKNKKVKVAIVTSDTVENTETILKFWKIESLVDCIIGKESTTQPKDTGVPAIEAVMKLESLLKNTIAIGDALIDIQMAREARLKGCIGVATGQVPIEVLRKSTKYIIGNLSELIIGD